MYYFSCKIFFMIYFDLVKSLEKALDQTMWFHPPNHQHLIQGVLRVVEEKVTPDNSVIKVRVSQINIIFRKLILEGATLFHVMSSRKKYRFFRMEVALFFG